MKTLKKNPQKRTSKSRPRGPVPKAEKSSRRKKIYYVSAQLLLALSALAAITRCSPLASSQPKAAWDQSHMGIGASAAGIASNPAGDHAVEAATAANLEKQIDSNPVFGVVDIAPLRSNAVVNVGNGAIAHLMLSQEQWSALLDHEFLTISLSNGMRAAGFRNEEIATSLQAVNATAPGDRKVKLRIFAEGRDLNHNSVSYPIRAFLVSDSTNALVKIVRPTGGTSLQNLINALRQAHHVAIDIHGN